MTHISDSLRAKSLRSAHIHPRSPHTHLTIIIYLCVCFLGAALHELEKDPAYWDAQARAMLDAALKLRPRDHRAKNIILFLGDGRSCCHYGWSLNRKSYCFQNQWQIPPNMQRKTMLKCVQLQLVCCAQEDGGTLCGWWCRCVSRFVRADDPVVIIKNVRFLKVITWAWQANTWTCAVMIQKEKGRSGVTLISKKRVHI